MDHLHLPGLSLLSRALVLCLAASLCAKTASGTGLPAQAEEAAALQVQGPTQRTEPALGAAPGLINLDVVVTDNSGKPISGLGPKDFSLLDNGQSQKILSFHAFDGISSKPDPSVRLILLIDTINMPFNLASYEREEVERFLRRNGGRLAHPVSIVGLSDTGLWTLAEPSADGNALAAEIASDRPAFIRRRRDIGRIEEASDSLPAGDPAGLSVLKSLGDISTTERGKLGRKLLIWVGPGRGVGSARDFKGLQDRHVTFDTIYWFSTLLREARIALYSFTVGEIDPETRSDPYMRFLNGVKSAQQASIKSLDRKVLAVESGGRVLGPGNDLVSQIDSCVEEADAFYTLSFDPSRAIFPASITACRYKSVSRD